MPAHVFFDIGGVLGTNGWDRAQRHAAAARFGLDEEEFALRHHEVVGDWEVGDLTLDEYLDTTVFYVDREFTRAEFRAFMLAQSHPWPDSIAVARRLAEGGRARLMTLNNESRELNAHRIGHFGLRPIFTAFLTSCWLDCRKPSREIFEAALGIAQAEAAASLFIDDREQNLAPARALGLDTVRFESAAQVHAELVRRQLLDE